MRIKFRPPAASCPRQLHGVWIGPIGNDELPHPFCGHLRTICRSELQIHKRKDPATQPSKSRRTSAKYRSHTRVEFPRYRSPISHKCPLRSCKVPLELHIKRRGRRDRDGKTHRFEPNENVSNSLKKDPCPPYAGGLDGIRSDIECLGSRGMQRRLMGGRDDRFISRSSEKTL